SSAQRFTTSSITISCATSRRSQPSSASPSSWWCIRRFRLRRSPGLSRTPRPIRARSTWRRLAPGPRLVGALFKAMANVDMVHVAYRGGAPALTDLIGGQVQVMFVGTPASIEYIRSGKLRALAVTTATRSEVLPDVPTVGEFVPGYEASTWFGVGAPKNTPSQIIDKLNKEINAGLADPKLKAQLASLGGTVLPGPPADFA